VGGIVDASGQVSSVTERGRVYGWLQDADDESVSASIDKDESGGGQPWCLGGLLSTSKLSQTVGHLSLQVAARLRHLLDAYDAYRYALAIFTDHHPTGRHVHITHPTWPLLV